MAHVGLKSKGGSERDGAEWLPFLVFDSSWDTTHSACTSLIRNTYADHGLEGGPPLGSMVN